MARESVLVPRIHRGPMGFSSSGRLHGSDVLFVAFSKQAERLLKLTQGLEHEATALGVVGVSVTDRLP